MPADMAHQAVQYDSVQATVQLVNTPLGQRQQDLLCLTASHVRLEGMSAQKAMLSASTVLLADTMMPFEAMMQSIASRVMPVDTALQVVP